MRAAPPIARAAPLRWAALPGQSGAAEVYAEQHRPQFHFTAKKGWLNDPNGLVYHDGQYHMFYQHNPFGEQWGNMTWGHATSPDLVHWTERSPALAADPVGVKFSGTAVIDHNNTAGLQTGDTPTMALFYTSVGGFDQRMAYSTDGGRSFRYHSGNPILPTQSGGLDDRDPQVFWHEESSKWVQVLWVPAHDGGPQTFQFFGSDNLTDWTYLSENPGFYECPDFFPLAVDGDPNDQQWVLYGADGRYQVGDFDGVSFTPQTPAAGMLEQDYGNSFYASQSWHNVPADDGRKIQVTWMRGGAFPGMPFNQQMGFPVELTLRDTPDGVRMFRTPVDEISLLHQDETSLANTRFGPGQDPLNGLSGELFHIKAEIELNTADSVGFNIRGSQVRYDVASQTLTALGRSAPLAPVNGRVQLELLVDRTSLELFGGDGRVSMSSSFLPPAGDKTISLFADGGAARVVSLSAYELASAWAAEPPRPTDGLLAHWAFDEPTLAANFINSAGEEFDLANSGLTSGGPGMAGQSASLGDAGDHAYAPNHTALNAESFTAAFWLRPAASDSDGAVLTKTHEQHGAWGVERLADGRVEFYVQTGPNARDTVRSAEPLPAHAWSHTAASYDAGTGRLELYVNGRFAGGSELQIDGAPLYDDSPLSVGATVVGPGGGANAAAGAIDDLQLYGAALSPGQVGHLFQNPGQSIAPQVFEPADLRLLIDPQTGAATVYNAGDATASLKGYSLLSLDAGLELSGWQSLSSNPATPGWQPALPGPSAISELNPTGSLAIAPGQAIALGTPTAAAGELPFGVRAINEDLGFEYSTADGGVFYGAVELVGPLAVNNLLLEVDPETGQATLSNASSHTVRVSGYSVLSSSGSLRPDDGDWNSLSDQGVPGADEANSQADHLSEFLAAAEGGLVFLPGQSHDLGAVLTPAAEGGRHDLRLEFVLSEHLPLAGDYNADGVVDAADYTVWRDALAGGAGLANETASPGVVDNDDYQAWRDNYGQRAGLQSTLLRGVVRYIEAADAAADTAPEPAGLTLLTLALLGAARRRARPHAA